MAKTTGARSTALAAAPATQKELTRADDLAGQFFSPKSRFMAAFKQSMPQAIIPAEALVRAAITTIRASSALQNCSTYSLISSIVEAGQVGLSLDVNLGQAYLVPFKGLAKLIYGYRGMVELARRSGLIRGIPAEMRYEKDKWQISYGTNRSLMHMPFDAPTVKRGKILGVYAVAEFIDGGTMFHYMDIEEINELAKRQIARKKDASSTIPWETNFNEMAKKTPTRRICKHLPQSPALITLVRAATRDEYREEGHHVPEVIDLPPVVQDALEQENVQPDPPAPAEQSESRESAVHESGNETDVITKTQRYDALTLLNDYNLESTDMPIALKNIGFAGKLETLPKAKFPELLTALEQMKKKNK